MATRLACLVSVAGLVAAVAVGAGAVAGGFCAGAAGLAAEVGVGGKGNVGGAGGAGVLAAWPEAKTGLTGGLSEATLCTGDSPRCGLLMLPSKVS